MNSLKKILFLLVSLSGFSQNIDFVNFKNKFIQSDKTLIFDDLTLINRSEKFEIPYSLFKRNIVDTGGNCLIETNDTINNKFFAEDRIDVFGEYLGLIYTHKSILSEKSTSLRVYISIFNGDKLLRTNLLWSNNSLDESTTCSLLLKEIFYEFKRVNNKTETSTYSKKGDLNDGMNKEDGFIFDEEVYDENFIAFPKTIALDSFPERNLNIDFDVKFFKSTKNLVPLKYLYDLNNLSNQKNIHSYFVGSKKIKENRVILIFLNENNLERFSEVKYFIIDYRSKIFDETILVKYYWDKNQIVAYNNALQLLKQF